MGLPAAVVKFFTNDEYASSGIKDFRQAVCSSCEFKKNGYCGKPVIGETITYKGEQKHLCGCITDEKTMLKNQTCPLQKW